MKMILLIKTAGVENLSALFLREFAYIRARRVALGLPPELLRPHFATVMEKLCGESCEVGKVGGFEVMCKIGLWN